MTVYFCIERFSKVIKKNIRSHYFKSTILWQSLYITHISCNLAEVFKKLYVFPDSLQIQLLFFKEKQKLALFDS